MQMGRHRVGTTTRGSPDAAPVVLGFSGLANARAFKAQLPGVARHEHAIFQGADAAAALVARNEVIAAAAEERFNGVKHSEAFPEGAAHFCLSRIGLLPEDVDCVAHSFCFSAVEDFYRSLSDYYETMYEEVLSPKVNREAAESALGIPLSGRYMSVPHHLAHAASAYLPSGFEQALVVVSDALGERNSASVIVARGEDFQTLLEIPAHSSLGLLYGVFTLYLGFGFNDGEYKVMGLAPYGDAERYADMIMDRWVHLEPDGRYMLSLLLENVSDLDKETHRAALAALERVLGPARARGAPIERRHADIAAGLQAVTQTAQMHVLEHAGRKTGLRSLAIAGGVGLNCVANGVLLRSGLFENIYVQPAAGDDGAALGAALYACRILGGAPKARRSPLLGPNYSYEECFAAARATPGLELLPFDDYAGLVEDVAERLESGMIVGWFHGRMELGPRALGNRSILGDPRRPDMRERINALVKKRESFRPFAPAVVADCAHRWFEIEPTQAQIFADMQFVAYVRKEYAKQLPAVTHVDGSARVQTVSAQRNRLFWTLLEAFGRRTSLPILLNTSFNIAGQPIVCTPAQAVRTALSARLDALVMDRLLVLPSELVQHA